MRNLKKVLSVLLVVAMLATAMVPAFAASFTYETQAKALYDLGLFKGESTSEYMPNLAGEVNRQQGVALIIRLLGKQAAVEAMTAAEVTAALANYTDVEDADEWALPYFAYAVKNGLVNGTSETTLGPTEEFEGKMFAAVLLRNLGYADTEYTYDDASAFLAEKGGLTAAEAVKFNDKALLRDDFVGMAYGSLKAPYKTGKTVIAQLVADNAVSETAAINAGVMEKVTQGVTVTNNAKSITVKFNVEPADASKVKITATRDTSIVVSESFTQDATDKTKFVYTSATNLSEGEYKVAVKDDTTDLGSTALTIKEEKIASIEILSKQIIRQSDTIGYVYYKVTNQYGDDVTKDSIATGIDWNTSLNVKPDDKKGMLVIEYGTEGSSDYYSMLKGYTTTPVVIYAIDRESGVTCNKSLTVSTSVGDIQSITLKAPYNKDGKTEIVRGNHADEFYIDYEIKDSNGDLITNYEILKNALTIYPSAEDTISIAAVKIKEDPADTNKALFQVVLKQTPNMSSAYDGVGVQPVNFIAGGTGKTGTINITVKDTTSELANFVIQRPTTDVTAGSGYVEIPYSATDSEGKAITSFSAISGKVTLGSTKENFKEVNMADGSYKLFYNFSGLAKDAIVTLSAQVDKTFKYSYTTVTVKEMSVPDSISALSFDQYMTWGANTSKSYVDGKVKVQDKYGNNIDLRNSNAKDGLTYFIVPELMGTTNNTNDRFTVTGAVYGLGEHKITVEANQTPGSADVRFHLVQTASAADIVADYQVVKTNTGSKYKVIDSKVMTFYNVDPKSITGYAVDAITDTLYATATQGTSYTKDINVKGLLSGGTKVVLPVKAVEEALDYTISGRAGQKQVVIIKGSYGVSDSTKFALKMDGSTVTKAVYAYAVAANTNEATGSATALVRGNNGMVTSVSTEIKSSNAVAIAKSAAVSLAASSGTAEQKITKKVDNYYEVSLSNIDVLVGKSLNGNGGTSDLKFKFKDQYGKDGVLNPSSLFVSSSTDSKYSIGADYVLSAATAPAVGDTMTITATSGSVAITITIEIK